MPVNASGQTSPNPWWHDTPNQTPPNPGSGDHGDSDHFPTHQQGDKRISVSDTILDKVIPVVYGEISVTGRVGFWDVRGSYLYLGIVFAYGEQDSMGTVLVNEESSTVGITKATAHTGDGSSAISTYLSGATGWVAGDTSHWQGYSHVALRVKLTSAKLPGSLVVRSKLGGKLVTPIGGGTATATTNPAVIAYDILTSAEQGNIDTSRLNADSFSMVADFCAEDTGDGKDRYAFVGPVYEQDPIRAANMVLGHCNGYLYAGPDGKIHCWAEALPGLITGTWTSTGIGGTLNSQMLEDSLAGAATTELEVGQVVVFDGEVGRVTGIIDDDTFNMLWVTSQPSNPSLPVRAGSSIEIEREDWCKRPGSSEQSVLKAPDQIRVAFTDADAEGRHTATVSYGAGTEKISRMALNVTDASHAVRIAKTKLLVAQLEPFFWSGSVLPEIGARLSPGDIVVINTDLVTDQPAAVQQPILINRDGSYSLKLREFDPAAFSEDTEVTDTLPSTTSAWDSTTTPVISNIQYEYSGSLYDLVGESSGVTVLGNISRTSRLDGTDIILPNDVPLYAKETGGTPRQAIKMDGSNRLQLGDGNTPVYLNASTSGGVLIPDDTPITAGWSVASNMIFYIYDSSANEHEVGRNTTGSPKLTLAGRPVEINSSGAINLTGYARFKGFQSYAGDPTSGLFSEQGAWGVWKNTSSGNVYLVFNDGGTIKKGQLT